MNQYILIKLRSGEEIVASILSKNRSGIKVSRPMLIRQVPFMDPSSGALKAASVMENWIGRTNENEVTIPNSWVGIKLTPAQEIVDAYEKYKNREDNPSLPPIKEEAKTIGEEVDEAKKKELAELEGEMTKLMKEMAADAGISPMINSMADFDSMMNNSKDANKEMVIVNFMIPGKIFKNLLEEGLIEDMMTAGMSDIDDDDEDMDLEDDVDPALPKKPKDDRDNIKDTGDEKWGNSLKDWSPDPNDYL
jgi:hypothetical protein